MSGGRSRSFAISSASTFASCFASPPPPYSFGHVGAVQPRSAMTSSQRFASPEHGILLPPQQSSSVALYVVYIDAGAFACSQRWVSSRKVSRSAAMVSSFRGTRRR